MNNKQFRLGILGGMGPLATCEFQRRILKHTPATCDQDHLETIVYNKTSIPNPTQHILLQQHHKVVDAIEKGIKALNQFPLDLIAMPCNTAHIWWNQIQKASRVPVFNMIEHAVNQTPKDCQVLITGTLATMHTELYLSAFKRKGITAYHPTLGEQHQLMQVIQNIKAGHFLSACKNDFLKIIDPYINAPNTYILLGCTELSVLFNDHEHPPFACLDPLTMAAISCVMGCTDRIATIN